MTVIVPVFKRYRLFAEQFFPRLHLLFVALDLSLELFKLRHVFLFVFFRLGEEFVVFFVYGFMLLQQFLALFLVGFFVAILNFCG